MPTACTVDPNPHPCIAELFSMLPTPVSQHLTEFFWQLSYFALECKYKYNCNYCSTKSSLPNLKENGVTSLLMNLL